jgi:hypothetical protein
VRTFGTDEILWRGATTPDMHVIVATRGSAWEHLCYAEAEWSPPKRGRREYETVEKDPKPTRDPVVWKHDRSKVTCAKCVAALGRLDPGFKPSNVDLFGSFPPLVGTMGRVETEVAAALLVRVCQAREDTWQEIDPAAIAEVAADVETKWVSSLIRNPFFKPSFHELITRGFAEWVGEATAESAGPMRFTAVGLAALKKWVRS